jgi:hypothetical protein
MRRFLQLLTLLLALYPASSLKAYQDEKVTEVQIYQLFELEVKHVSTHPDPVKDVELTFTVTSPEGKTLHHFGFYDGGQTWKVRFSPDATGMWRYEYQFSGESEKNAGEFRCIASSQPGRVMKNELNPFWLGKGGSQKTLFRSFHAGDRFFASNWDDPDDPTDGNKREVFLNWLQQNGYNMLTIASHYTNRDEEGRGKGWDTPTLWPINPEEYRKMEKILDELKERDITVFPFAGFFGARGNWPLDPADQEIYIKYILARIGHYPNTILAVAGPEPFWRKDRNQYKNSMRQVDILRLAQLIDRFDVHNHILTIHNEKRATENGDPFIDEPWYDMSTLQGPTTVDVNELYTGLAMNHHRYKPVYAQETLWAGNLYHPDYTDDQLRKNTFTILFSGSILNFADMKGNSSTGFSGTLDPADANPSKHEVVKKVWDWFETIPFHQFVSRQDLVKQGFCLAWEGVEYYVYLDKPGEVELFLDLPYYLNSEWINAKNPTDVRPGKPVNQKTVFTTPADGDDWILHVAAPKPGPVAKGNFPDIAVDTSGNLHIVYNRSGLFYRKYSAETGKWSEEVAVGCSCNQVNRSDPDIVTDSHGNPHVFCGNEYAWFNGKKWEKTTTKAQRDTELEIDSDDNIYIVHRGGNNGGFIGLLAKNPKGRWTELTDPDKLHKGPNDHVYCDLAIDQNNIIHLVQRHGPEVEVTYRRSDDGGKTWNIEEPVSNERTEAPHIEAGSNGNIIIATGKGLIFERDGNGIWTEHGRRITAGGRMQPELGVDANNTIYLTSFGGRFNTLYRGFWTGERKFDPVTGGSQVGFVETAGFKDFAYIIWEEGAGNADEGLHDDASVFVGIVHPDGRITGLY